LTAKLPEAEEKVKNAIKKINDETYEIERER